MDGPAESEAGLPLIADAPARPSAAATGYRVLARKYRPSTFDDLIGQEPMVQTLSNAFETGRIHQAYMLTGVRGVGKTTTARILARALNYLIPGEVERPTIHMPKLGVHCQAIIEGRHVDVIEMDAASHTGINDIREIIEASRYKPVSARTKVYIIDEVHMLSTAAFNGLLKTLEEPPEHVKFIFATTEIRKVPITVLSRCQRFDLRRIDAELLKRHFAKVIAAEGVSIDDDALRLIARAAEGSARDGLSLLDQAIAHGSTGHIDAATVRDMLGLADRSRVIDLFEALMKGDIATALGELRAQYTIGADPLVVLADLAEFTHFVTRLKLVPDSAADAAATPDEAARGATFAAALSIKVLSRAWQMLLKGHDEVKNAPKPYAAAEMVLVRIAYAADLPTPDEAVRKLTEDGGAPRGGGPNGGTGGGGRADMARRPGGFETLSVVSGGRMGPGGGGAMASLTPAPAAPPAPQAPDRPVIALRSLAEAAALAGEKRDIRLKTALERQVRPIRFDPTGTIEVALTKDAPTDLAGELGRKLTDWTGQRWLVVVSRETGGETLAETRATTQTRLMDDARADPLVAAVLARFPGAQVVDVRVTVTEDTDPGLTSGPTETAVPFDHTAPPDEDED